MHTLVIKNTQEMRPTLNKVSLIIILKLAVNKTTNTPRINNAYKVALLLQRRPEKVDNTH